VFKCGSEVEWRGWGREEEEEEEESHNYYVTRDHKYRKIKLNEREMHPRNLNSIELTKEDGEEVE